MNVPGESSGTYNFFLSNSEIVFEAFDRIRVRPSEITAHHLISARRSLNLLLVDWSNKGINLWEVVQAQLTPIVGQATYTLPSNLVTITEMYWTTINGNGPAYNSDRIMIPQTRQQYAMVPNKLLPGIPTTYWLQRLESPVVTIWQPPMQGSSTYVINYNYLQRVQDAGIGSGETPDVVYRALDALCAGLADRLALKFTPPEFASMVLPAVKEEAQMSWDAFVGQDQEEGPVIMQPNVGGYARMRR